MATWSPWENANYCWVVICKNKRFHQHTNLMFGHKIPLGEADAVSPPPALNRHFRARCDECEEEYDYETRSSWLSFGLTTSEAESKIGRRFCNIRKIQ